MSGGGAPVRLGFLSTARINTQLLLASHGSERARVVAVASRRPERAEAYARRNDIPRAHGSYEALLVDPDVEAVYVSLPNSLHVEWSIRALEAGKHVLCEKPLSRRPADVEAAFAAAEQHGRVLVEAFMYRHHVQTARVARLVATGALGRLAYVHATMSFPLRDADDPRLDPALDGGALMDLGCYGVSIARLLAGEPERASGEQVLAPTGVDMRFAGTLRFGDDVVAHIDCAMDQPRRDRLEIVGTEGSIEVADPWHGRAATFSLRRDFVVEEVAFPRGDPYRLELEAFCDAVRGVAPPRWGREDAVGQAAAIDALHRAAELGQAVAIGPFARSAGTEQGTEF